MIPKIAQMKQKHKRYPDEPNPIVRIDLGANARDALTSMSEQGIHHLIVEDENEIIGTLTDRDLFFHLFKSSPSGVMNLNEFPIKNAVRHSGPPISADTTVAQALAWMEELGLSVLISREGTEIVGLVTDSDLLRATHLYWREKGVMRQLINEGEAVIANPLVQTLMRSLADMGL